MHVYSPFIKITYILTSLEQVLRVIWGACLPGWSPHFAPNNSQLSHCTVFFQSTWMWFKYSYVCDEAPIKKLRWASRWRCFVHDVTRHSWEEAMLSRALEGEVSWIPPRHPFFWLVLIIPLSYNKIAVLSVTHSWVLWIILVDYYNWEWLSETCQWNWY